MQTENKMKTNLWKYALLLPLMYLPFGNRVMAQDVTEMNRVKKEKADSVIHQQKTDSDYLSGLKTNRTETRRKAKEAQSIERDANTSAKESRIAYKSEKRAQKARTKADKQAKKAKKAKDVSDKN